MGRETSSVDQILASLTEDETRALAALAVVGKSTLAPEFLAGLGGAAEAAGAVESLRAKGLVEEDEEGRTSALRSLGERIRRTEAAIATGERLLRAFTTLAQADRLGRAELEAILSPQAGRPRPRAGRSSSSSWRRSSRCGGSWTVSTSGSSSSSAGSRRRAGLVTGRRRLGFSAR